MRGWPLALGVITAALAIIYTFVTDVWPGIEGTASELLFRFIIILLPIVTSVLLAIETEFKAGSKWVLLRGAAETLKGEIYRYRVMKYLVERQGAEDAHQKERRKARAELARQMARITSGVMSTEASESALVRYRGSLPPPMYGAAASDDGFSPMSAQQYLKIRAGDQLNYFRARTEKLDRQLRWYQVLILLYGAAGSLLAAVGAELWIPLTTTVVTALTSYLGYYQVKEALKQYNQGENNLNNIESWWLSLDEEERAKDNRIEQLVDDTETILRTENTAWVQKMQEAILQEQARSAAEESEEGVGAKETAEDSEEGGNEPHPDLPPSAELEPSSVTTLPDGQSVESVEETPDSPTGTDEERVEDTIEVSEPSSNEPDGDEPGG